MMNPIALVDPNRVALGIILSPSGFPSESPSNSRSVPSRKSVLLFLIQTTSGPTRLWLSPGVSLPCSLPTGAIYPGQLETILVMQFDQFRKHLKTSLSLNTLTRVG